MTARIDRAEWLFIVILLLFAAAMGIMGTSYGQPDPQYAPSTYPLQQIHQLTPIHPDDYFTVTIPMDMHLRGTYNPRFFEYPSFVINLNYVIYGLTGATNGITLEGLKGLSLRQYAPFHLYVLTRMYAVFGLMLMVAGAYAAARITSGRYAALAAGLLVATSYTLVQYAHYTKPVSLGAGFAAVATWASIAALYAHRPRQRHRVYLLGGLMTGLAATTIYSAAAVSIILFLAGLVLLYRHRTRTTALVVLAGWALAPLVFILGTPYAVLDFSFFLEQFQYITGQFLSTGANIQEIFITDRWTGLALMYRYLIVFSLGVPASAAVVIAVYGAWRDRPPLRDFLRTNSRALVVAILLVFLLAYSFVALRTIRPNYGDDLLVVILPQFILLAGIGAGWLYRHIRLPPRLLAPGLALLLLIVPLVLSVQLVRMFVQPDTRQIILPWIYDHLPRGSNVILNGPYNVPLDAADYPNHPVFGAYIPLDDPLVTSWGDYMIFADPLYFDIQRSWEIVSPEAIQESRAYLAALDRTFPRIATVERPRWTGWDWFLNMAPYWHDPGLIVYCLNETSCAALR